ncbi:MULTISPECIES: DUF7660 family protein [unclassified Xanthomonas]|uniref:DUF7660 family protein n=1 Tax=Xanthomonas sp. LMG 9002 TaxID=1591158 RepID=UPI001371C038|nr:hypothetical protein [Xanthomonas sp. LMG 9002]MXV05667.1 hypothetical protein [Xanthomonas sp. LMG 9002]
MTHDPLFDALLSVEGKASFMRFVALLIAERSAVDSQTPSSDGFQGAWANHSIADFLGAANAWAEDSEFGARPGPKPTNVWRLFATFLFAGRSYE